MKKKIVMIFLASIIMLTNSMSIFAATPPPQNSTKLVVAYDIDDGKKQGILDGDFDGYTQGKMYYNNKNTTATYTGTVMAGLDKQLRNPTNSNKSTSWKTGYKAGYYIGYEYGFNLGIAGSDYAVYDDGTGKGTGSVSDTSVTVPTLSVEASAGQSGGLDAGSNQGTIEGSIDFSSGLVYDPNRSLTNYKSAESIYDRYSLNRMTDEYVKYFIPSFDPAYIKSYQEAYISLVQNTTSKNYLYQEVGMLDSSYKITIEESQGINSENYDYVTFDIPKGTVAGDGYIGASRDNSLAPLVYPTNIFKYVKDPFVVKAFDVTNKIRSEYITFNAPFTMGMEYYGSDNVGIYQFKNNEWQYIYTDIKDGSVSHTFPAGEYGGGKYILFTEPIYTTFDDTNLNWANMEIYTYARRGWIYAAGKNLYPNSYISRAEFAYILSGVLNSNNQYVAPTKDFDDAWSFDGFANAINFVVANNYMYGTSDTHFDPYGQISYAQVEAVINRIPGQNFSWPDVEASMLNQKYYKSKGTNDKSLPITRAEAIYSLYYTFQ